MHTSNEHMQYTCTRIHSFVPRLLPHQKKVEGLGTSLACPLRANLLHVFECARVHVRVLACTRTNTRVCVFEYSRATHEGCQVAREWQCTLDT